ncbi:Eco57I restriction-modification methylase domain-containing protein [Corynebacterium coyleae]|uniref:Eco57I restriction-modification methylase domain-containing protein n=1 Tax=Corynebacterium coyleae TaxID=53374 RepID=UPI000C794004|nr:N-6 DNA methylase [Corynebacterium coyleae]PLA27408.1 SAM-dependent methyltransferase [Corynebacterium coyleae]
MKTKQEVSDAKLRGGFYSPEELVNFCADRILERLGSQSSLSVLEPSSGDGAFIRGVSKTKLAENIKTFDCVEIDDDAVRTTRSTLMESPFEGTVHHENVLKWDSSTKKTYDIVLANPPYVRYQYVSTEDRGLAASILKKLGLATRGVSNLWIPVLLLSLNKLRPSGVFAVILPSEFMTGISASSARKWILQNFERVRLDLFPPKSFPGVLQEVIVLSGTRKSQPDLNNSQNPVTFVDNATPARSWTHLVDYARGTWTGYLLSSEHQSAIEKVSQHSACRQLRQLARFSVSTVTGANEFFCVDSNTVERYALSEWSVPLLARTRFAPGLKFLPSDHVAVQSTGKAAWLLSFSGEDSIDTLGAKASAYLKLGEEMGYQNRYKTRIRSPWYRVPVVRPGQLLMAKRSNYYPRVIVNSAEAFTTDTVYRGEILRGNTDLTPADFAASFHNSVTLLSAEIEGRSFGGGVLELVPSEIGALTVIALQGFGKHLDTLDALYRKRPGDLVDRTDELILEAIPSLDRDAYHLIQEARVILESRRILRGKTPTTV